MIDPMNDVDNENSGSVLITSRHIVAVVILCYKVSRHILAVLQRIGDECSRIYVADDYCPEGLRPLG